MMPRCTGSSSNVRESSDVGPKDGGVATTLPDQRGVTARLQPTHNHEEIRWTR